MPDHRFTSSGWLSEFHKVTQQVAREDPGDVVIDDFSDLPIKRCLLHHRITTMDSHHRNRVSNEQLPDKIVKLFCLCDLTKRGYKYSSIAFTTIQIKGFVVVLLLC